MAGFLDDLPDLGFERKPPRRPKAKPAPEVDCVTWTRPLCPKCGSPDCLVIDSHAKPVRWHQCKACGHKFKSIETNYKPATGYTWRALLIAATEAGLPGEPANGDAYATVVHHASGLKIVWFFDAGSLDYIDHFETPDGVVIDFWDWPEGTPGRRELIEFRG